MDQKSFIMYHDMWEQLSELTDEEIGKITRATFIYHSTGEIIDIGRLCNIIFKNIKTMLDRDRIKYIEYIEKQSDNGKKGGRPKGNSEKYSLSGKLIPRSVGEGEHFIYLIRDTSNGEYKIGETKNLYNRIHTIKRPTENLEVFDFGKMNPFDAQMIEKYVLKEYQDKIISGDWIRISELEAKTISSYFDKNNPPLFLETQAFIKKAKKADSVSPSDSASDIYNPTDNEKNISILESFKSKYPNGSTRFRFYSFFIENIELLETQLTETKVEEIEKKLGEFRDKLGEEKAKLEIQSFLEWHGEERSKFKSIIGRLNTWLSNKLK